MIGPPDPTTLNKEERRWYRRKSLHLGVIAVISAKRFIEAVRDKVLERALKRSEEDLEVAAALEKDVVEPEAVRSTAGGASPEISEEAERVLQSAHSTGERRPSLARIAEASDP